MSFPLVASSSRPSSSSGLPSSLALTFAHTLTHYLSPSYGPSTPFQSLHLAPPPTPKMAPPFRAEHMGSLLRPQPLLDAREAIRQGQTPEAAGLHALETKAVADVVQLQQDAGFRAVTSGEFNRTRFWGRMWDEFDGTVALPEAEASLFRLYHPDVVSLIEKDRQVMPGDSVIAGGKLGWTAGRAGKSNLHELQLIQASLPKEKWADIKLTLITPAWFHMRYKQNKAWKEGVYASDAEYFKDVGKVYQAELDTLYKAGLRNVQFDDPGLACMSPLLTAPLSLPSS